LSFLLESETLLHGTPRLIATVGDSGQCGRFRIAA
jgi:hypothetical protein